MMNHVQQDRSLAELLANIPHGCRTAVNGARVSAITADSRQAVSGSVFIALRGLHVDGHSYVRKAVGQGCRTVVVAKDAADAFSDIDAQIILVDDTRQAYALLAAAFYGYPAEKLCLIGITGTNGKTTTSFLIEALCRTAGWNPGVVGTVNYRYGTVERDAPFTTPEPICLHGLFRDMITAGVTHVVMEVSSHALTQGRLEGIEFDVAVFTNLSRDHLDYHGSMEAYFDAKKTLFSHHLKKNGIAVIMESHSCATFEETARQDWGRQLVKELGSIKKEAPCIIRCGFSIGDIYVSEHRMDLDGITGSIVTPHGAIALRTTLTGDFNLENILTATGVAHGLGMPPDVISKGLAAATPAPGRLEQTACRQGVKVFVDYSHTPDALAQVLMSMRRLGPHRLVVVFGCGGDRDRGKRPIMGEVAGRQADCIILTSDNPRSEDPFTILHEVEAGLRKTATHRHRAELFLSKGWRGFYDVIESRRDAIRTAIRYASEGDVILIAGKGHERYQIRREGVMFFDDRLEAVTAGRRV